MLLGHMALTYLDAEIAAACLIIINIDICFHLLSHVLAKARGSNTINLYTRQQRVNQFPNTKAIPADDTYVIEYMLNLF